MKCPPILATEQELLQALSEYGLGSDRPLPSLDPVVQIATRVFGMPVSGPEFSEVFGLGALVRTNARA